jgi:hypothetical protein
MWNNSAYDLLLPGVTIWAGPGGNGKTTGALAHVKYLLSSMYSTSAFGIVKLPFSILKSQIAKKDGIGTIPAAYDELALSFLSIALQSSIYYPMKISTDKELSQLVSSLQEASAAISGQYREVLVASGLSFNKARSDSDTLEKEIQNLNEGVVSSNLAVLLSSAMARRVISQHSTWNVDLRMTVFVLSTLVATKFLSHTVPMCSIKNETTVTTEGMDFQLLGNDTPTYAVRIPLRKSRAYFNTAITASAVTLVKAMSFVSVVRVGTINSAFAQHINYASTLKGGLDEGVILVVQEMNDMAAATGGRIVAELKDDFVSSASSNPYEQNATLENRIVSSSRIGIYITSRGHARVRVRNYGTDENQFHETISYSLDDIPGVVSAESQMSESSTAPLLEDEPWSKMKALSLE